MAARFSIGIAAIALIASASCAWAHNCTCLNKGGARYKLGEIACLDVNGDRFLARCEMKLNVPSWTRVQDGCPASRREGAGMSVPQT
jgi:hypothetical protein